MSPLQKQPFDKKNFEPLFIMLSSFETEFILTQLQAFHIILDDGLEIEGITKKQRDELTTFTNTAIGLLQAKGRQSIQ